MFKKKFVEPSKLASLRKRLKNKKIVFVNGSWDMLHIGHARYLRKVKKFGDVLVVGVRSDQSIKQEDERATYLSEKLRAEMLTHLLNVDYVIISTGRDALPQIADLQPDVFCVGKDYLGEEEKSKEWLKRVGKFAKKVKEVKAEGPKISSRFLFEKVIRKGIKFLLD